VHSVAGELGLECDIHDGWGLNRLVGNGEVIGQLFVKR
jgi:hypothetical protein